MAPRRWHVWIVDLAPRVGTKPGKQRPCLVVQPDEFGAAGHPSTVVLPMTSRTVAGDAFPLRVRVPAGVYGLERPSDILVDQVLAWDNTLFRKDLGPVPEAIRDEVRRALREFLDLDG